MQPKIELKALCYDYSPLMVEAALESVEQINPWMDWCTEKFSLESANAFIALQIENRKQARAYEFSVFDDQGNLIGGGGVNNINYECNLANIGYWVRTSQAGKGYGTATLKALVAWAREHTKLNRLEVVVATENYASQRVALKSGATLEGIAKSRLFNNGQYFDAKMYVFTLPTYSGEKPQA